MNYEALAALVVSRASQAGFMVVLGKFNSLVLTHTAVGGWEFDQEG